jgi:two-component system cell cycle response regulator CpdR
MRARLNPFRFFSNFAGQCRPMAKILVVEDDDSVRALAARALERLGHTIDLANDGSAGLSRIIERDADYDLVLSDIRMPEMDGIEMARSAAARYPRLKIMFFTGYADQRERAEQLNGTVVDVMQKPFALAELRDRVERALTL